MDRKNIFLTETRRDVLDGTAEMDEAQIENHKSRIRTRARAAIDELIEVAQSEEIESQSVFEPGKIGTLLYFILNDPAEMGGFGGAVGSADPSEVDLPDNMYTQWPESFQEYRQQVAGEIAPSIMSIRNPNRGRFDD